MKITKIERELSHKIFVGGFETIQPTIRVTAELEATDDPDEARKALDQVVEAMWVKECLGELRLVHKRRNPNEPVKEDKLPMLMETFKGMVKP